MFFNRPFHVSERQESNMEGGGGLTGGRDGPTGFLPFAQLRLSGKIQFAVNAVLVKRDPTA